MGKFTIKNETLKWFGRWVIWAGIVLYGFLSKKRFQGDYYSEVVVFAVLSLGCLLVTFCFGFYFFRTGEFFASTLAVLSGLVLHLLFGVLVCYSHPTNNGPLQRKGPW